MNKLTTTFALAVLTMGIITGIASAGLNDGLVAYYPFNGNANDESGNGNDGIVYGATLTQDRFGTAARAYYFDGVDDYIDIGDDPSLKMTEGVSISAWINVASYPVWYQNIIGDSGPSEITEGPGKVLRFHNKRLQFIVDGIYGWGTATYVEYTFNDDMLDQWQHVVGTYDRNTVKLYLNGALVAFLSHNAPLTITSNPVLIGVSGFGSDYFHGSVDDVRFYDRALTEAEIQELANEIPQVNQAPVAVDDTYSVDEDATLNVVAPGVLANDSDVEDDPLTVILADDPAHGTLLLDSDGSFTYTPNADYCGADSFTYTVSDGNGGTDTATVTADIACVNDAPVAVDDAYSVGEDQTLTAAPPTGLQLSKAQPIHSFVEGFDIGDVDNDGAEELVVTKPLSQQVEVYDSLYDLEYTISLDNTPRAIAVADLDDDGRNELVVTTSAGAITCGDPTPECLVSVSSSTPGPAYVGEVMSNGGFSIEWTSPAHAFRWPTHLDVFDLDADGQIELVMGLSWWERKLVAYEYNGSTYVQSFEDNIGSDVESVYAAGDMLLVGTACWSDYGLRVYRASSLIFSDLGDQRSYDVVAGDVDGDGGLEIVRGLAGTCNDATPAPTFWIYDETFTPVFASPGLSQNYNTLPFLAVGELIQGGGEEIAVGTQSYFAKPELNSVILFQYDGATYVEIGREDLDSLDSDPYHLQIADLDGDAHNELFVSTTDGMLVYSKARVGVLGNDSDADGDPLSVSLVGYVSHGTLDLSSNGYFSYTPDPDFNGTDSFSYQANDGTGDSNIAAVTITVNPVNDAPVAEDDAAETDEDVPVDIDVLANDWDVDGDNLTVISVTDGSNGTVTVLNGGVRYSPNVGFVGEDSFTYTISDGNGGTATAMVAVTVIPANKPPTASAGGPYSGNEGSGIALSGASASDPDNDPLTISWSADSALCSFDEATALNPILTCDDNGGYIVTLTVDDGVNDPVSSDASATVNNVAPTASFNTPVDVNEGSDINLSLIAPSDPSSADTSAGFEYAFDCGEGAGYSTFSISNSAVCPTNDNDIRTAKGKIKDKDGGETEYTANVAVNNVAPTIETISVPLEPVNINDQSPFSVDVTFSDPAGANDEPYTCTFDLDNDGVDDTTVGGIAGTSCNAALSYAGPGVYSVKVTVTDEEGGTGNATATEFIVVYDPEGGFVTGGGWINSPPGACHFDSCTDDTTGKANFGFVSKYKKGANVPTGETEFQFKAGDLNFHSDSYEWLVIANHKAMYKGEGTINGVGNYGFMLSAIDEKLTPSTDVDLFRIKIWDTDNDAVVYDNQMGDADDADPATAIGGGNIVIHN